MTSDFTQLKYKNEISVHLKAARLLWTVVRLLLFRPTPRWALHGWRRTLLRLFGAKIGPGCRIAPSCLVWAPWNLEMGTLSALGDGVDCYTMDRITIGSKVAVSQRAFLCAGSHDITSLRRPLVTAPITIGDHVWIAAEALVLPGVKIGNGTVVGARAVVSKNLPDWVVCAGHPCRPLRPRKIADSELRSSTSV